MQDLKDFVQMQIKQQHIAQMPEVIERKEKWLSELGKLLQFIQNALLDAGLAGGQITLQAYTLNEPALGVYEAPGLIVQLPAGGQVMFVPVGSTIVGGTARVDVTGPNGARIKLIADDGDGDKWVWQAYPRLGSGGAFRFDEQGLTQSLVAVTQPCER